MADFLEVVHMIYQLPTGVRGSLVRGVLSWSREALVGAGRQEPWVQNPVPVLNSVLTCFLTLPYREPVSGQSYSGR